MKKIIIVNNNMEAGGIQKALVNLLQAASPRLDITLLLFCKTGALMSEIPESVRVICPMSCYRMLGLGKKELSSYPLLFAIKAALKVFARLFGKRNAMRLLGAFQKKLTGYDIAISYSHLTGSRSFDNGCAEFVLDKIQANRKSCFIHCDYKDSGTSSPENDKLYQLFDEIICVSDSVRKRLVDVAPVLCDKAVVIRNFYDTTIEKKAYEEPIVYDASYINLLIVARLSPEKGVDRAVSALEKSGREDIRIHVVGDGPQREELKRLCIEKGLEDKVLFLGEQKNPYRYMLNADYLLVPSVHEAAPMVFDEAHMLSLPIISTRLLSSGEMLCSEDAECENSVEGIARALAELQKKEKNRVSQWTNADRIQLFFDYIEGR